MRDRFDEIRAERDVHSGEPVVYNRDPHAGLWKQIALGIVVGYLALKVKDLIWFYTLR